MQTAGDYTRPGPCLTAVVRHMDRMGARSFQPNRTPSTARRNQAQCVMEAAVIVCDASPIRERDSQTSLWLCAVNTR